MQDREKLTLDQIRDEKLMLQIRLREGLAKSELTASQIAALEEYSDEILQIDERIVLTAKGRLIADRIVRSLVMA